MLQSECVCSKNDATSPAQRRRPWDGAPSIQCTFDFNDGDPFVCDVHADHIPKSWRQYPYILEISCLCGDHDEEERRSRGYASQTTTTTTTTTRRATSREWTDAYRWLTAIGAIYNNNDEDDDNKAYAPQWLLDVTRDFDFLIDVCWPFDDLFHWCSHHFNDDDDDEQQLVASRCVDIPSPRTGCRNGGVCIPELGLCNCSDPTIAGSDCSINLLSSSSSVLCHEHGRRRLKLSTAAINLRTSVLSSFTTPLYWQATGLVVDSSSSSSSSATGLSKCDCSQQILENTRRYDEHVQWLYLSDEAVRQQRYVWTMPANTRQQALVFAHLFPDCTGFEWHATTGLVHLVFAQDNERGQQSLYATFIHEDETIHSYKLVTTINHYGFASSSLCDPFSTIYPYATATATASSSPSSSPPHRADLQYPDGSLCNMHSDLRNTFSPDSNTCRCSVDFTAPDCSVRKIDHCCYDARNGVARQCPFHSAASSVRNAASTYSRAWCTGFDVDCVGELAMNGSGDDDNNNSELSVSVRCLCPQHELGARDAPYLDAWCFESRCRNGKGCGEESHAGYCEAIPAIGDQKKYNYVCRCRHNLYPQYFLGTTGCTVDIGQDQAWLEACSIQRKPVQRRPPTTRQQLLAADYNITIPLTVPGNQWLPECGGTGQCEIAAVAAAAADTDADADIRQSATCVSY